MRVCMKPFNGIKTITGSNMKTIATLLYILILSLCSVSTQAQGLIRIPAISALSGSHTHVYVLSAQEGLAVFNATADSLVWLYTSDAMLRRGTHLRSDARFAYLFGSENRLTIIDPTVSQGLYAVAVFDQEPKGVARIGSRLFVALGEGGIGSVSLASRSEINDSFEAVPAKVGPNESIVDIVASSNRFFALGSTGTIYPFLISSGRILQEAPVNVGQPIQRLFEDQADFLLSTEDGQLFEWKRGAQAIDLGTVNGDVDWAQRMGSSWIVRTLDGKVWSLEDGKAYPIRDNASAGNHVLVNKEVLWLSEFDRLRRIDVIPKPAVSDSSRSSSEMISNNVKISALANSSIPFPQPYLTYFSLDEGSLDGVNWFVRHGDNPIPTRGNALKWQPKTSDIGQNTFTVIATNSAGASDSTRFSIDVRAFNAPPRLTPVRQVSIPVDEPFTLQLSGFDPDGSDSELIRFSGVNLPEGVEIDAETGLLKWTPNDRQIGRNVLQIVTSDQYGASMASEIILNVIRLRR